MQEDWIERCVMWECVGKLVLFRCCPEYVVVGEFHGIFCDDGSSIHTSLKGQPSWPETFLSE